MSVVGNTTEIPNPACPVVGFVWHTCTATSYTTVGGSSSAKKIYNVDTDYFSYSSGTFTCKKAGTYYLTIYGRGGYRSSGNVARMQYRVYAGGSNVLNNTTGINYNGGTASTSVTLAVGDTVYAQTRNDTSSNTHCMGLSIQTTEQITS